MGSTKCKKCHETKAADAFYKKHRTCKVCVKAKGKQYRQDNKEALAAKAKTPEARARAKQYRQDNKEALAAKRKQYTQDNKEAIAAKAKQYRQDNKEALTAKAKRHYEDNREELLAKRKRYRQDNKEALAAKAKQYRQDNKEAIAAKNKQYRQDNKQALAAKARAKAKTPEAKARAKQYYEDNKEAIAAKAKTPEARARNNAYMRSRNATPEGKLERAANNLHRQFFLGLLTGDRVARGEKLVGCSREQYRNHIASQLKRGMSYDNYGDWELDHIVPKRAFKGELGANLAVVYWYGNVQPLWKAENISKGGKYTDEAKQSLISIYESWKAAGSPPPGL